MRFRLRALLILAGLWAARAALAQAGPPNQPDSTVDPRARSQIIQGIVTALNRSYIYPETAAKMGQHLEAQENAGAYANLSSAKAFAEKLTDDLQSVSHDKHLHVMYSFDPLPDFNAAQPSAADRDRMRKHAAEMNFGFERVERLSGNVGYLDLRGFMPLEVAKDTAVAAMEFLGHTDALIIDLRKNGGGGPDMVAFLCSYFFGSSRVHLNDLYWRERNKTDEFWTTPDVPGPKYLDKPVYLLTSSHTFSAAEEFTYDLQNQKRVIIVGETTGGGAHPGGPERLNDHFAVWIPRGRAINPVTKTDWEGVGIKPDIPTSAAEALKSAHVAALEAILTHTQDAHRKAELTNAIAEVKKQ
jgi:hypothetical protein